MRVVVTFNSFSLSQQPSLIGLFIANTKSVAVTIAEAGWLADDGATNCRRMMGTGTQFGR